MVWKVGVGGGFKGVGGGYLFREGLGDWGVVMGVRGVGDGEF